MHRRSNTREISFDHVSFVVIGSCAHAHAAATQSANSARPTA
jgi:hypothetical protein